jgi:hypothetical protein
MLVLKYALRAAIERVNIAQRCVRSEPPPSPTIGPPLSAMGGLNPCAYPLRRLSPLARTVVVGYQRPSLMGGKLLHALVKGLYKHWSWLRPRRTDSWRPI